MTYDKKFIDAALELFAKIKQNATIQECLNQHAKAATNSNEPLWFIYYMFYAIHNPKMEEYIQKKTSTTPDTSAAHIIKNMIKRRESTSSIVFQLYMHAYTNQGNVSVIYPKDKDNLANQMIRSFQSNRLKTTAVLLRKALVHHAHAHDHAHAHAHDHDHAHDDISTFLEYVITTQPVSTASSTVTSILDKINNHINYSQKNIILLALMCYMKIDDSDINKKTIFISATPEEEVLIAIHTPATATATTTATTTTATAYDEKYKYLYT